VTDELNKMFDALVPPTTHEPDWDDVLERATAAVPLRQNRRLWYALAAAAVLLALLVSPAFGLGDRLVDFFTGSPAPKPVKRELSLGSNTEADRRIDELMHQEVEDSVVLTGQARGLFAVRTPAGILRIWGAPTSDGGLCTYLVLGEAPGRLSCDTVDPDQATLVGIADRATANGHTVRFVSAQALTEGASVQLRLADRSVVPVPSVGRFYFRLLQPGEDPVMLVGRDSVGNALTEVPLTLAAPPPGVPQPVLPVGPEHVLAELVTRIGRVTFSVAPGPDGKQCWTVAARAEQGISCRRISRAIEFDFGPYHDAQQTRQIVVLSGLVREDVSTLELQFEDGSSTPIELLDRAFVRELPRRYWPTGHRPTVLVARDDDGTVLGRRRVVR
jgi:hypothetical protein